LQTEKRNNGVLAESVPVGFQPARFSVFDLQKAQMYCHKKFYSLDYREEVFLEL
jgi:hypothetical protein